MTTYLDTSDLIALREPHDRNHAVASKVLRSLMEQNETLLIGTHTLVEFADGLEHRYGQAIAAKESQRILASPRIRMHGSDAHLQAALQMLQERTDWNVDLSDCLSFVLMQAEGTQMAFTYDRDFEKAGFLLASST